MKASELKEKLSEFPDDTEIFVYVNSREVAEVCPILEVSLVSKNGVRQMYQAYDREYFPSVAEIVVHVGRFDSINL